jgi:hypothetical protein
VSAALRSGSAFERPHGDSRQQYSAHVHGRAAEPVRRIEWGSKLRSQLFYELRNNSTVSGMILLIEETWKSSRINQETQTHFYFLRNNDTCYWKWRHSLRFFGGRRQEVIRKGWVALPGLRIKRVDRNPPPEAREQPPFLSYYDLCRLPRPGPPPPFDLEMDPRAPRRALG